MVVGKGCGAFLLLHTRLFRLYYLNQTTFFEFHSYTLPIVSELVLFLEYFIGVRDYFSEKKEKLQVDHELGNSKLGETRRILSCITAQKVPFCSGILVVVGKLKGWS